MARYPLREIEPELVEALQVYRLADVLLQPVLFDDAEGQVGEYPADLLRRRLRHGSERLDLAEAAVTHPDEVEAALVVSHQEPRQVSIARQEDFQHRIGRGLGKGRVGLAVALDDVGDGETPHAVR